MNPTPSMTLSYERASIMRPTLWDRDEKGNQRADEIELTPWLAFAAAIGW
jgi:hypothetical protein